MEKVFSLCSVTQLLPHYDKTIGQVGSLIQVKKIPNDE